MVQQQFDRINELARKSKVTPLTHAELDEQKQLRDEYIAAYRKSLRSSLELITLVDENGIKTPLKPNERSTTKGKTE